MNMVTILMGVIGFIFPIGAGLFIFAIQAINNNNPLGSIPYFILGILVWLIGLIAWNYLKKAQNKEDSLKNKRYQKQLKELKGIRVDIRDSINKLVNEIRQDRNERNNKSQPKPKL